MKKKKSKRLENIEESDKNKLKRKKAASFRRKGDRRFYSQLDMSIVKRDNAFKNSQIKRGVIPDFPVNNIVECGCGAIGCFLHTGSNENHEHVNAPVNMYPGKEV